MESCLKHYVFALTPRAQRPQPQSGSGAPRHVPQRLATALGTVCELSTAASVPQDADSGPRASGAGGALHGALRLLATTGAIATPALRRILGVTGHQDAALGSLSIGMHMAITLVDRVLTCTRTCNVRTTVISSGGRYRISVKVLLLKLSCLYTVSVNRI